MKSFIKWVSIFIIFSSVVIFVLFITIRIRQGYRNQNDVAELKSSISKLEQEVHNQHNAYESRLKVIEEKLAIEVIPDLKDKKRPITSSEAWQRNFYAKHEKEITNAQRKLMTYEYEIQQLKNRILVLELRR